MLVNVSYNDSKLKKEIDASVGLPFNLKKRFILKGIGSGKLLVKESSPSINSLFSLDQNLNTCSIELRTKGIIVRFRSLLETYALVIPYYKLNIFKGESNSYTIFCGSHKIRLAANSDQIHSFFSKINRLKAEASSELY